MNDGKSAALAARLQYLTEATAELTKLNDKLIELRAALDHLNYVMVNATKQVKTKPDKFEELN